MANITIIVPIYKVEEYISKCLDSLLNQTYKEFEIWAVDDGSPDNSGRIVEEYSRKDSRVKYIKKKNGGYGSVLEYCINNINTDYFLICDPDDWLSTNALEELYKVAKTNDADLVLGDKYLVYTDMSTPKYVQSFPNRLGIKPYKIYMSKNEVARISLGEASPHAKLFKTRIIKGIRFPHHVSYTDMILYNVALMNAKKVIYINKPLAYYLIDRPGNTMTDVSVKNIKDHLIVWNSIYEQARKINNSEIYFYNLYNLFKVNVKLSKNYINKQDIKNELINEILKLQKYKSKIKKYATNKDIRIFNKKLGIIFFYLFMNKKTIKIAVPLYIKVNQIQERFNK